MNTPAESLAGKRILFIGVKFYFYTDAIIAKMRENGAEVDFFYERDTSIRHGLIDSFFNSYLEKWQEKHYRGILSKVGRKSYDFLFVIRGYRMKGWFVEEVRRLFPGIRTIQYQWDSYRNWDCDYRGLIPYFDKTATFDYADAAELKIPYIPTFYIDEVALLKPVEPLYDLFFSGYYNAERYEFVQRLIAHAAERHLLLKTHLYIDRKRFIREKLSGTKLDRAYLSFTKLSKTAYLDLFNRSKVIIDLPNSVQTGMTMRVIDSLGAGKRVLTANTFAAHEPGYDSRQVIVFDKTHLDLPSWLADGACFEKKDYSIGIWLGRIFA
jgi:hypothetical protein